MKKIVILLTETNCEINKGHAVIYDKCNEFESFNPIVYPIEYDNKDIATLASGGTAPLDYSITIDHIGGRPNKR